MNIATVFSAGLVIAVIALTLSGIRPDYAKIIGLCGGIIIVLAVFPYAERIFEVIKTSAENANINTSYILIVLKCTGIACVSAICSDTCRDMGQVALARELELAARIAIILTAIPAINALLTLIENTV
jgi:stage III sporulation protein AD